jgi:ADP-ribose pyrophosphatase YjhB (NUDIX family)
MSEQKNIKVRLRLVIIKNNKLLVTYDSVDNYFFYIGGKLEFGETVENGCRREIIEECGLKTKFVFKKILYIRDFIIPEKNEHSLELFILGGINRFEELEGKKDGEFQGRKWLAWLTMDKLPDNLFPKALTPKLFGDYRGGFPKSGEYIGRI